MTFTFDVDTWQLLTIRSNYFLEPIHLSENSIYELGSYISSIRIQPPQIVYSHYNNTANQQRFIKLFDTDISQCPVNIDNNNIDTFISCFN